MMERRSLILVTVDCLRADHLGFLGYQRPTTPFLDSLAPSSCIFEEAVATGSPTYYSFPGIMASRYPLDLGRETIGLAPSENTLATCLKKAGYSTAAFIAGNPYLTDRFGYDSGFDNFEDFLDRQPGSVSHSPESSRVTRFNRGISKACHSLEVLGPLYDEAYFRYTSWKALNQRKTMGELRASPPANEIVDRACEWLKTAREPFFLWLHLMDAHAPYYPPLEASAQMGSAIDTRRMRYLNLWWNRDDLKAPSFCAHLNEVIELYDAGIRWVDCQLARFVEQLQLLRMWNRCVFALTADHGEEFLDHGGRYHKTSSLFQELLHVPLLIRTPGASGHRETAPFSLLNLAPTLLGCLGVNSPEGFRGQSYWNQEANSDCIAISECVAGCNNPYIETNRFGPRLLSLRQSHYKLLIDFRNSTEHFFDLKRDPGELHPLPREHSKPIRSRLLEEARKHLAAAAESNCESKIAARLRDLQTQARLRKTAEQQSPSLVEVLV